MHDQSWLWHRRLGHANMDLISQLNKDELVRGLLKINFQKDKVCEACQMGKQIKNSFKNKNFISTTRLLELLHMHLFGPSRTPSLGGNLMHLLLWMTSLDTLRSYFSVKRMKPFMSFQSFVTRFKMKKVLKLLV